MNRLIKGMLCGVIGLGGVASSGCMHSKADKGEIYPRYADPCWPERYASQARELKVAAFEPQVANGHVLDQTIWNTHFETGSEKLNAAGMDKLDQLARRRPAPDAVIYLQTARDINYDADKAADYGTKRTDIDSKRIASIQKYLGATLTGRSATFTVQIHDPSVPGIDGAAPRVVIPSPRNRTGGGGAAGAQAGGAGAGFGGSGAGAGAGAGGAQGGMPAGGAGAGAGAGTAPTPGM